MKKTLLLKLIATKKLDMSEGLIQLQGSYFNLVPAIFISSLTEHFHRKDELYKLYLLSWFWGYDVVQTVKTEFGLEDPEEIYSTGMDFAESQGIGLYRTDNYYPGRYTEFKIKTNPYMKHLGPKNYSKPMDYFIAGAMAGGGSHVHEAVCQCIETSCKIQGSDKCDFITGTEEELKNREIWDLAEERYQLEKIIEFQKDVYNNYTGDQSDKYVEKLSVVTEEL